MCRYIINENFCSILNSTCPWTYCCNKSKKWIFKKEGEKCKVFLNSFVPEGYCKVCFEKRGNLYISINNQIQVVPNPFNDVPLYVKATKLKNGKWRLKKYEG